MKSTFWIGAARIPSENGLLMVSRVVVMLIKHIEPTSPYKPFIAWKLD